MSSIWPLVAITQLKYTHIIIIIIIILLLLLLVIVDSLKILCFSPLQDMTIIGLVLHQSGIPAAEEVATGKQG